MIEVGTGNLLKADVEALVNTVNCVGIMGKGIALQFKQAHPDNFKAYEKACRAGELSPGKMFILPTNRLLNPKFIINFPTKRHWKDSSRIEDIEQGLQALVADIDQLGIRSIAIPPLGCGNGGLSWSDVKPLIEASFKSLPTVRVVLYEPKGAPSPTDMPIGTKAPALTRAMAALVRLVDIYEIPGYEVTLLEIQKLAYFLQASGEPLKLQYSKEQFGPFANNLNHVLQKLEGHFISGYGDRTFGRKQIRTLPGASKLANDYLRSYPDSLSRLQKVSKLIEGFETPYGMELLATVHWVAVHDDPNAAEQCERAIVGVQAWSKRKSTLFSASHIEKAWLQLSDLDWLRSANIAGRNIGQIER